VEVVVRKKKIVEALHNKLEENRFFRWKGHLLRREENRYVSKMV